MIGHIYITTNIIDGKQYIGQTHRIKDSNKYMGSGNIIKAIIKKYGKNVLHKEILKDNIKCITALNLYEKIFIKKHNTISPNGYNLAIGGNGCMVKPKLEEINKRISDKLKGHNVSDETRKRISHNTKLAMSNPEIIKRLSNAKKGKPPHNKGIPHSEKSKQLNREKHIGKIPWNKGLKTGKGQKEFRKVTIL